VKKPKESYFILTSSEDGISIAGPLSESHVMAKIKERHEDYDIAPRFYDEVPDMDKGCFCERDNEEGMLIIKGSIVVPTPKTSVTEWSLPSGGVASDE
jgi:hypothetical protein